MNRRPTRTRHQPGISVIAGRDHTLYSTRRDKWISRWLRLNSGLITGSWKVPARRLNRGVQLWLLPETHIPATACIVHSFPPWAAAETIPALSRAFRGPFAGPPKGPSCEIPEFCKRSRSVPARRAPDRFLLAPSTIVHHRQTPRWTARRRGESNSRSTPEK